MRSDGVNPRWVRIHYLRPPDREEVFRQELLHDAPTVKVTLARDLARDGPLVIDGRTALEAGSHVVWFTFPHAWHDIGTFHAPTGTRTGVYANVLTPPTMAPGDVWHTTDLFLDVWQPPGDAARVLDRDEFEGAVTAGWIDRATRDRALDEVNRILADAATGRWPPPVVEAWPLARALEASAASRGS